MRLWRRHITNSETITSTLNAPCSVSFVHLCVQLNYDKLTVLADGDAKWVVLVRCN